jgi:dynein assembly factor 2
MVSRSGLRVEGLHVDGATTAVPTTQPLTMENARGSSEDLNLTPEEVDKFQTAFKDENFKKMFAEYAKEISDPKNKAESDAYLKQLEYEGRIEKVYGKDVQLVMPKPGFVAKTFQEGEGGEGEGSDPSQNSSDSKKTKSKAFINICRGRCV